MEKINFLKMHGQGNDFILIDSTKKDFNFKPEQIKKICDRHFGIGADGLILVKNSKLADFLMDYYNQDGTSAEMCGNGIRCMAAFIIYNKLSDKKILNIETKAGIKKVEINNSNLIKVNMGSPIFNPDSIPFILADKTLQNINNLKILNYPLSFNYADISLKFNINAVSMGNPHCVIFLDDNLDNFNSSYNINNIPIEKWGPALENNPFFPKKTNVEFIEIINKDEIAMRVWERGVGETLACGTGACASAVCAIELGKIKSSCVKVNLLGGQLKIYWEGSKSNNKDVFLEGKVNIVFSGIYFLNN